MTFENFTYARPDLAALTETFNTLLANFQKTDTPAEQLAALEKLNQQREEFWAMYNLCYVRHTADTKDKFYEAENDFFDQNLPAVEELSNQFYRALLAAPNRDLLTENIGNQVFVLAELSLKTFQPKIMRDLQRENASNSKYDKIKARAKVRFGGKTYNLSSIQPLEQSDDRQIRQRATEAKWSFYAKQQGKMEQIFDRLVKLRHGMARKMGFKNFVEVGYARMRRSDYTPEMVANFRRQVEELIVPIASKLYERQGQRLGLDGLKIWDEDYKFATGNPKPKDNPAGIIASASTMYRELSTETDKFFQHMQAAHLMDLENRDGKVQGGYCTYLSKWKAPYIFSNFNGTSGDIDVLTHEAGHAFQVFSSSHFAWEEYHWPTSDAAEIHSMSMEFFTWPWMPLFFGGQTEKYYFQHLAGAVQFLPYGVAIDEFQHLVYENPDMTPAERNETWRSLERRYLPHRNYGGIEYLESGCFWQKQAHLFNNPFYYIDYALAQICAFQFWTRDRENHAAAWADYLRLCQAGGSQSFLNLVQLAGLRSPFEDGCVASVVGEIGRFLAGVEDVGF